MLELDGVLLALVAVQTGACRVRLAAVLARHLLAWRLKIPRKKLSVKIRTMTCVNHGHVNDLGLEVDVLHVLLERLLVGRAVVAAAAREDLARRAFVHHSLVNAQRLRGSDTQTLGISVSVDCARRKR